MTKSLNHIRQDNQIYALDIGSSSIRLLSGSITPRKQIIINGLIQCPSKGIIQGEIVDINILAKQIAFLIQEFQIKYDVIIDQIITGVSGLFILSENLHGFCTVQDEVIDFEARELAINNAIAGFNNTYAEYSIIQLIPQGYQTETLKYVKAPIGLYAQRLDVDVHVIACNYIYKKKSRTCDKKDQSRS